MRRNFARPSIICITLLVSCKPCIYLFIRPLLVQVKCRHKHNFIEIRKFIKYKIQRKKYTVTRSSNIYFNSCITILIYLAFLIIITVKDNNTFLFSSSARAKVDYLLSFYSCFPKVELRKALLSHLCCYIAAVLSFIFQISEIYNKTQINIPNILLNLNTFIFRTGEAASRSFLT